MQGEAEVVPRVSDIVASLPSLTGKIELEYEGELKGAEQVARELVRQAVATVFDATGSDLDTRGIIGWFNDGGEIDLSDTTPATALLEAVIDIPGVADAIAALGAAPGAPDSTRAAAADFLLEGLCALRRISRDDAGRLLGTAPRPKTPAHPFDALEGEDDDTDEESMPKGRKKKRYYN
jgi:magnesium chelatase subunit I